MLPSPTLPNHRSVGNNVGNPAFNIMKTGQRNIFLR